eukprot:CAMPEP_0115352178 /NCGR_PEP_ID=MMETSP0270-20121206/97369_1 /TAXON_ID=71861 /ORGANISM="Scrippsiella trochoidea, Strain CCMP3099" /LENGTH=106 /DNA_ID=CAMNT_0002774337 /DNA_START=293 /DNA_END=609 /DNA_ORIENTATION=+
MLVMIILPNAWKAHLLALCGMKQFSWGSFSFCPDAMLHSHLVSESEALGWPQVHQRSQLWRAGRCSQRLADLSADLSTFHPLLPEPPAHPGKAKCHPAAATVLSCT